jgi:small-conductance mechanosensitive channel
MVGRVVFWFVMALFVMATTEILGLPVVTTWLSSVASYLPRLLAAAVIVAVGMVTGRLTKRAVARAAASAGMTGGQRLGRVAEIVILFGSILVAAEQLGLDLRFVTAVLTIVLATTLGGAALAFGLGSRQLVENILSGHYVRKLYAVGQVVRIEGVEGRILKLTATSVILETPDGEVAVPAREFTVTRSMRISNGSR